jgi:hypothetical protein
LRVRRLAGLVRRDRGIGAPPRTGEIGVVKTGTVVALDFIPGTGTRV